ncbi:SMI1/KNR4 family protein [Nocardioides astragali]|uniref:Knr4/Smi1-like domain-containing protein n=1 Tax=Nocardioides astragali TaxID=1776736 RepID=A0ABW2N6K8_9ACTN|nr:SMI1/KNR4 family protein [Nocardioides astragali]
MDGEIVPELLAGVTPGRTRIEWARIEAWLGTPLPGAYRQLCDRFGSLYVGDWLWLHAPVRFTEYSPFDRELAAIRSEARDACEATGLPAPVFHPKKGGLLPFGSSRGGEGVFWDTSGEDPDDWPVVVLAHAAGAYGNARWVRSGLTLVPFLEALVTTGVRGTDGAEYGPLPASMARAYVDASTSYWTPPDRAARSDPRRKGLTAGSGLKALQVLVPPQPPSAGHRPPEERDDLPADYLALIAAYGPGTWRGWLRVAAPADLGPGGRREMPWAVARRDDDFLPFADSIDGDVLGWVRRGDPDRWPIAWVPRHDDPGPAQQLTFTSVLLSWLRGKPVGTVLAPPDPDIDLVDQATFEPWTVG